VNPQEGDSAGRVVTVGDTGGTVPPCKGDMQPVISTVSMAMHITDKTEKVFIESSPFLNTTDTCDDMYGFVRG
jgi:hypothetical protein